VTAEDLEVIRGLYSAMSSRDLEALRAFADEHPDFEWQSAPDEPETDVRRGREHNVAYSRELLETFEQLETKVRDVIELGPDEAIFVVHHRVRGASSGVEVERSEAHLWTKEGGRIARLREFATVEDARACARPS
jgi:ketosteroid isomerase-like protein